MFLLFTAVYAIKLTRFLTSASPTSPWFMYLRRWHITRHQAPVRPCTPSSALLHSSLDTLTLYYLSRHEHNTAVGSVAKSWRADGRLGRGHKLCYRTKCRPEGLHPTRKLSTGRFQFLSVVPLSPAEQFYTRISAGMNPLWAAIRS